MSDGACGNLEIHSIIFDVCTDNLKTVERTDTILEQPKSIDELHSLSLCVECLQLQLGQLLAF